MEFGLFLSLNDKRHLFMELLPIHQKIFEVRGKKVMLTLI